LEDRKDEVNEWTGKLRGVSFGAGSSWEIDETGIAGLGAPAPTENDVDRGDRDGTIGGLEVLPRRVLTIPLVGSFASPGAAWAAFATLKAAWRKSSGEEALDLRLPGMTSDGLRYYGRPRGLLEDLAALKSSTIRTLATFHALDPLAYGPEVVAGPGTTVVVANPGAEDTDRVTLKVIGDGGTPTITNADDGGGSIVFSSSVANTDERRIDLRAHTVTDETGTDRYSEVLSASTWFVLRPGTNTLTVTGATSAEVTFRPAYL